jgi:hypothetical protein
MISLSIYRPMCGEELEDRNPMKLPGDFEHDIQLFPDSEAERDEEAEYSKTRS